MSRVTRTLPFLLCLATVPLLLACKADVSGLSTLTVQELADQLGPESALALCDANNEETRSRYGTIPGATLLSNYRDYDLALELPSDRGHQLVFYCHSEMCGAAASAARKAVAAGFTNVYVLPSGIKGWIHEGQPVAKSAEG